jgi:putative ABC transport system permease protein
VLGRAFTPEEANQPGAAAVAMISEGLWRRRFAADPAVLGRSVQLNRLPYTVVGVLPRGFRGLSGHADVWVPLAVHEPSQLTQAMSHSYYLAARRRIEVTEAQAKAAVDALGPEIDRIHSRSEGGPAWGARAVSLADSRADADVRRGSLVLLGAVGFVLLIGCVNLTNLVAARSLSRRREVAVRVAIGASRGRIVGQFLAEGALLAFGGAIAGLAVAAVMLAVASIVLPEADVFFRTAVAPGTPRTAGAAGLTRIGAAMIGLDGATLLFTAGVATLTALLVSLLPAARAAMLRPVEALKAGAATSGTRRHDAVLRAALVTAQIALAVILLSGASLMVRSARHLGTTAIGVTHDNIVTARVFLPRSSYSAAAGGALFEQLGARLRALPGVESVGLGSCAPVSGGCSSSIMWFPPAKFRGGGQDPPVDVHWATPDYFSTLGITLIAGRLFTEFDRPGQPEVLIVNEHAARTLWPNDSPIGKRATVGMGSLGRDGGVIVGVVADVRYRAIESAAGAAVYLPLAQNYQPGMRLFVRSALDPADLTGTIAREVRALDPSLPISEIKTMRQRLADAMWRTRVSAGLLTGLAALALLLTAIGIFGVMAQTVMQRTPEIGVRIALGAGSRDVAALVLKNIATITAAGIAIGIAGALGLTRLIGNMLYGVTPGDPLTMVAVVVMLAVVAIAAGYLPVRRATRVDAIAALKSE